jgi:O-glycosyl hydrolase
MWEMNATNDVCYGGFAMFRNYDGANGSFGDTSVQATSSAIAVGSVYASVDAGSPSRVVLVAINRDTAAKTAGIRVTHTAAFGKAQVYRLSGTATAPVRDADINITNTNAFLYSMPAMSVSTLVLVP